MEIFNRNIDYNLKKSLPQSATLTAPSSEGAESCLVHDLTQV